MASYSNLQDYYAKQLLANVDNTSISTASSSVLTKKDLQYAVAKLRGDDTELDLTQNAIEDLADIKELLYRAENDGRRIDTIVLTMTQGQVFANIPPTAGRPAIPTSLFGKAIKYREIN